MSIMTVKPYYTVRETNYICNHGTTKTYSLIAQDRLVAVKAGRKTLITGTSIEEYLSTLPRAVFRTGLNSRAA